MTKIEKIIEEEFLSGDRIDSKNTAFKTGIQDMIITKTDKADKADKADREKAWFKQIVYYMIKDDNRDAKWEQIDKYINEHYHVSAFANNNKMSLVCSYLDKIESIDSLVDLLKNSRLQIQKINCPKYIMDNIALLQKIVGKLGIYKKGYDLKIGDNKNTLIDSKLIEQQRLRSDEIRQENEGAQVKQQVLHRNKQEQQELEDFHSKKEKGNLSKQRQVDESRTPGVGEDHKTMLSRSEIFERKSQLNRARNLKYGDNNWQAGGIHNAYDVVRQYTVKMETDEEYFEREIPMVKKDYPELFEQIDKLEYNNASVDKNLIKEYLKNTFDKYYIGRMKQYIIKKFTNGKNINNPKIKGTAHRIVHSLLNDRIEEINIANKIDSVEEISANHINDTNKKINDTNKKIDPPVSINTLLSKRYKEFGLTLEDIEKQEEILKQIQEDNKKKKEEKEEKERLKTERLKKEFLEQIAKVKEKLAKAIKKVKKSKKSKTLFEECKLRGERDRKQRIADRRRDRGMSVYEVNESTNAQQIIVLAIQITKEELGVTCYEKALECLKRCQRLLGKENQQEVITELKEIIDVYINLGGFALQDIGAGPDSKITTKQVQQERHNTVVNAIKKLKVREAKIDEKKKYWSK